MTLVFADNADSQSLDCSQRRTDPKMLHTIECCQECAGDFFFTADFIYWRTSEKGTALGHTGVINPYNPNPLPPVPSAKQGKYVYLGHAWEPGFKVGFGWNSTHDRWDVYTQYTWLHSRNSRTISDPVNGIRQPTTSEPNGIFGALREAGTATGSWKHHFNVIDLELGRRCCVSQFLLLRPFVGLKGGWQQRDMVRSFFSPVPNPLFPIPGVPSQPNVLRVHDHFDVWGIGVRGGVNSSWIICKNWSLFGDLAWTSMWSDYYKVLRSDKVTNLVTKYITVFLDLNGDTRFEVNYIGELALGVRWETCLCKAKYRLAVQAGWEQQVWINYMAAAQALDDAWHDLNFQGLDLKFRFEF